MNFIENLQHAFTTHIDHSGAFVTYFRWFLYFLSMTNRYAKYKTALFQIELKMFEKEWKFESHELSTYINMKWERKTRNIHILTNGQWPSHKGTQNRFRTHNSICLNSEFKTLMNEISSKRWEWRWIIWMK